MNTICSPAGIVNPFRPSQGIMDIVNAGFEKISLELDMCCSGYELEHFGELPGEEEGSADRLFPPVPAHPSEIGSFFKKMLTACAQAHLQVAVARAPYLQRDTRRTDLKELLIRIQEECIRLCGRIGCRFIVIRPLYAGTAPEETWGVNRDYYLRLVPAARENDVMILLENQCRSMNGHLIRGLCSDGSIAAEWVDVLNREAGGSGNPVNDRSREWIGGSDGQADGDVGMQKEKKYFGFCMDTGICSLCGQDMREFAVALGDRIKAVVLRDCDGNHEGAMLPFTCTHYGQPQTEWLGLIRGLREIGFDGQMILYIPDTALSFSPLLRPQLMTLARAVAEYFKWQIGIENLLKKYDSIVLFGAGNMCRNYMKCYGETYPPLFTCDNNRKVWGTYFSGLEVKPPEALKDLPEGCGVFICNIYYREIEEQLRDMGIEHIEFFNDEYMPSFYFDRLKGM